MQRVAVSSGSIPFELALGGPAGVAGPGTPRLAEAFALGVAWPSRGSWTVSGCSGPLSDATRRAGRHVAPAPPPGFYITPLRPSREPARGNQDKGRQLF